MRFRDTFFSRDDRYSLGVEDATGKFYLSIPVSNGIVDYEEFYELSHQEYDQFLADGIAAARFADECRQHQRDELLIQEPGWNRGTPV